MSTKAKIITALIYLLAAGLLVTVIYMNTHEGDVPEGGNNPTTSAVASGNVATTEEVDLPYNPAASDKYANIEPEYKVEDITVEKDGNDVWSAFVDGRKVTDYIGVARSQYGWYFVRDGEVDFHYNGIAGNEKGNWYVEKGKVNFKYTGTFTVNGTTYKVVEGQVIDD